MKILILHPQVSAEHEWAAKLKLQGHAVLTSDQEKEAWQILQLHGESIDLVVVHREGMSGKGEPGFELIKKIRRNPEFADLPYILTSEFMDSSDFGQHQRTPLGANAYLRAPFETETLLKIIQEVLPSEKTQQMTATVGKPIPPPTDGLTRVLVGPGGTQTAAPTSGSQIRSFADLKVDSKNDMSAITIEEASFTPTNTKGLTPSIHLDVGEFSAADVEQPHVASSSLESGVIVVGEEPTFDAGIGIDNFAGSVSDQVGDPIETLHLPEPLSDSPDFGDEPALDLSPDTGKMQSEPELDLDALEAMPYVFRDPSKPTAASETVAPSHLYTQPVHDSIIPGGVSGNTDLETLKKYLFFREQDVAVLSNQLKETKQQLEEVTQALHLERAMATEMKHTVDEQKRRIEGFETERRVLLEGFTRESDELRFQIKGKHDKARLLEAQVKEAVDEVDRIKERVRLDIRKIRTREKELENRLEINRRDGEALLTLRETRIVELKRKLDLMEFNMDLLQNQFEREKSNNKKLRELFERASQVVKVAGGLLEVNEPSTEGNATGGTGGGNGSTKAAS